MPIVQRLKTRPQFQVTLACGIVSRTAHFALHRSPLDRSPAGDGRPDHAGPDARPLFGVQDVWVGAMVPKRWARRAVTRNTIKRQIYQVSAAFEPRLPAEAHVVRLRATFDRSQFISATSDVLKRAVRAELEQLFGRVADTGVDPVPLMTKCRDILKPRPKAELLWASPRELLNIFQADEIGCHIITVTHDVLAKLALVGKDLDDYSLDTVKMFYKDATAAGFSIRTRAAAE